MARIGEGAGLSGHTAGSSRGLHGRSSKPCSLFFLFYCLLLARTLYHSFTLSLPLCLLRALLHPHLHLI